MTKKLETIHNLNDAVDKKAAVTIVGGGINGLATANELLGRGVGQVELFDMSSGNATLTAGAQVYPYIAGENPLLDPDDRELLPYERAYLPCILQHLGSSMAAYAEYAKIENSGVASSIVTELAGEGNEPDWITNDLMSAKSYQLPHERLMMTSNRADDYFTKYYDMASYGVDTLAHFLYLKDQFRERGGIWHEKTQVTADAIQSFNKGILVVATGHRENELRPNHLFPPYKKLGMSAVYRTEELLPENPVLGYGSFLYRTHSDHHGITIGGFALDDYYDGNGVPSIGRFDKDRATPILDQCLEDVKNPFGSWNGLPIDALRQSTPKIRFGVRSMGTFGLTVEQDEKRPNTIWINGAGSIGISLAHGVKQEVADVVCEIDSSSTRLDRRNSIQYREDRPSHDVLRFQSTVNDIHIIMEGIAARRETMGLREERIRYWWDN